MAGHDRVWITRREDIARHWMAVHPAGRGAIMSALPGCENHHRDIVRRWFMVALPNQRSAMPIAIVIIRRTFAEEREQLT